MNGVSLHLCKHLCLNKKGKRIFLFLLIPRAFANPRPLFCLIAFYPQDIYRAIDRHLALVFAQIIWDFTPVILYTTPSKVL
jgi:hypothetical protein